MCHYRSVGVWVTEPQFSLNIQGQEIPSVCMHEGNFLVGNKLASYFQTYIQFVHCPEIPKLLLFSWIVCSQTLLTRYEGDKKKILSFKLKSAVPLFFFFSTVRGEKARQTFIKELKKLWFFFSSLSASRKFPWALIININSAATGNFQHWTHLCACSVKK